MYCPNCGAKLPELEWRELRDSQLYADTTCPNPDCEQVIVLTNNRSYSQEGKIEIVLF